MNWTGAYGRYHCWKRNVDFLHTGITCSSSCRCRSMCTSMQLILERDSSSGFLLLFFMHLISQVLLRKQSGPNGRINWKHRSVRRWDYGVLSLLVRFPLILVSFSSKSFTDSIIQRENYTSRSLGPICDKCSSEEKKNTSQLCPEIENYWSELFNALSEAIAAEPISMLLFGRVSELN